MRNLYFFSFFVLLLTCGNAFSQKYAQPESVVYDQQRDCYYISNVGVQGVYDGQIIKRNANGTLEYLIAANQLQDPKGMYIVGDTLFVADNYKLYYINLTSRTIVGSTTLGLTNLFLNDIVADEQGYIYISDTYQANIFRVKASKPDEFEQLSFLGSMSNANGMILDKENNRILIVTYQPNALIYALSLETFQISVIRNSSLSYLDGIARDREGNYYVSAWGNNNMGGIYKYDKNLTEPPTLVYGPLNGPADILIDTINNILVIPEMGASKVHFVSLSSEIQPPRLFFPPNNSNGLGRSVDFRFSNVFEAVRYEVQLSNDESFSNVLLSKEVYDTLLSLELEQVSTKYYWRVRSFSLTEQSEWSEVWSFTSAAHFYEKPELLQPSNGNLKTPRQPTFVWTKSNQALYKLQIWTNDKAQGNPYIEIGNIADTTYKLNINLELQNTYFWRVMAYSGYVNSGWSEISMFYVSETAPAAPQLYSPENDAINVSLTPNFVWQKTDAENYRIQVSKTSNFNSVVLDITELTDTTYTPSEQLDENTRYWWRVRAYTGSQGRWSPVFSFTTLNLASVSERSNRLKIYPNPANKYINIISEDEIYEVLITNSIGQLVANYNINGEKTFKIDIDSVNSGNYYILIKSKNNVYLEKLIIEK
ncbi:MAG TPA: T9SS type A sorting domain-containing protein [Candidatus Kapabacteria bacterium]|jgi:sugar lactone lactonase YvrE|nr:T9SS type A sorting domain-containing protein [Candidatus Kapabacteria bacterium]